MDEDPSSRLTVQVDDPAWHGLISDVERCCRAAVEATFAVVAAPPGVACASIDLLLADDATLRRLNDRWRGLDRPTNVLSFPALDLDPDAPPALPPGPRMPLGDLAVGRETVAREADDLARAPADHLGHLVVHGVLHLLGYDHQREADAERMETLERQILGRLGIADPYAGADPQ